MRHDLVGAGIKYGSCFGDCSHFVIDNSLEKALSSRFWSLASLQNTLRLDVPEAQNSHAEQFWTCDHPRDSALLKGHGFHVCDRNAGHPDPATSLCCGSIKDIPFVEAPHTGLFILAHAAMPLPVAPHTTCESSHHRTQSARTLLHDTARVTRTSPRQSSSQARIHSTSALSHQQEIDFDTSM